MTRWMIDKGVYDEKVTDSYFSFGLADPFGG